MDMNFGLGQCHTSPDHPPASSIISLRNSKTGEHRVALTCGACSAAHSMIEIASQLLPMGFPMLGLANDLLVNISVSLDVGIEIVENAIQVATLDDEPMSQLRDALREMRNDRDTNLTPITTNEFAALMARSNVINPKDTKEIN